MTQLRLTSTDETTQLLPATRLTSTDVSAQLLPATRLNALSDAARAATASMTMPPSYPVPQAEAVAGPGSGEVRNQQPASDQPNQSSSAVDILSTLAKLLTENSNKNRLPVLEPEMFTGNVEKFPVWIKGFETYVEHRTSCPIERLHFLGKYTGGDAHSAISGFIHLRTSEAYTKAKEKLVSRYGNNYLLTNSYSKRLRDWPVIRGGDNKGLQQLADFLEHCLMASSAIPGMRTLDEPYTVQLVLKKLPHYVSDRWKRIVDSSVFGCSPRYPTFASFVDFMTKEARIACGPVSMQMEGEADTRTARPRGKVHTFSSSAEVCNACGQQSNPAREKSVTRSRQCAICGADHSVTSCSKFSKMTLTDRRHAVEEKRLCRGCLRPGHMWRDCRRKERCSVCQRLHPSLLHDDAIRMKTKEDTGKTSQPRGSQQRASMETSAKATTMRSSLGDVQEHNSSHCHTMIVPVKVYHRHRPERALVTYALLDAQSDASFMTDSVCKTLQVSGSEVELELSTMAGTTSFSSQSVKDLRIESLVDGITTDLPAMYTREQIPADRNMIPQSKTCKKWPHLRQIADHIPDEFADAEIGLLLGVNCARAIKPREIIPGDNDDPWAVRTMLGWGIVGLVSETSPKACFLVGTNNQSRLCHFSYKTRVKETSLRQLQSVFDCDFFDGKAGKPMSQEDISFVQTMESGMHQLNDGHYEAPLPLKPDGGPLPNNRDLAKSRLRWLKQNLVKNKELRDDYEAFMKELLDRGYAERVPETELKIEDGQVNYVPHHGVYHPKKRKLRVVFDCSATYKDDSLNNHLLQGPDENNNLIGILIRLREGAVAFCGDIEGMFHQVRVNTEHRNLLRFLWWEEGNLESEPTEFRMCTHLFGATSSPAVALCALRRTADEHGDDSATGASNFVKNSFYIDDGVFSTSNSSEALQLIQDAVELCDKGGFRLHKFMSNDAEVLKKLPIYSLSRSSREAICEGKPLPCERVLGIQWNTSNDTLCIEPTLPEKPATRRGILSSLSSLYDPLGFLSPCTLVAKNLLKKLCTDKYDWDDPVPDEILSEWIRWKTEATQLSELRIPRCYFSTNHGPVKKYELHHFSDASYDGCGQCSYLRAAYEDGHITSSLVMSKTKVTPLKSVTIPRLELVAALMSVRVSCFLRSELTIKEFDEFFWTDSTAVLGYVKNDTKRFHVYVANRVQEIRQSTNPEQWLYIESKMNPADLASRGATVAELIESSLWWHGPPFLTAKQSLPVTEQQFSVADEDPEVKRSTFQTAASQKPEAKEEEMTKEKKKTMMKEVNELCASSEEDENLTPVTPQDESHKVTGERSKDEQDVAQAPMPDLPRRMTYFSNWHRAKKSVALCIRYKHVLAAKVNAGRCTTSKVNGQDPRVGKPLTVEELHRGETEILKTTQQEAFPDEYALLSTARTEKKNSKKSRLFRLDPYLDKDGVIRVGGRISRSAMPQEASHPVILPRHSHVTELLVKHYHEKTGHSGRGSTLSELRAAGYWIVGGRSAVSSHILSCVTCKKLRGKPQEQKMADLPPERTEPAEPFTHCAVDCFGPFYIKDRRSQLKRWGLLFTCLASRAIHLESVNSLSTDSFLNAYKRFVSRRGAVRTLFCDNGTNFVGGKNTLEEALKEEDHANIRNELLKAECDWCEFRFNVPHASSMGGVWERMIRSARTALTALITTHGHTMDDELFRTLLTEAEAIVNSRPLTYVSSAPDDTPTPLSPNQLLTLKSRVATPYPGSFSPVDLYVRQRWRRVQFLANQFWTRWRREFLPTLQERQKWLNKRPNLQPGDVVAVIDDAEPRPRWPLGRIVEVYPGADGLVRKVCIRIGSSRFDRPVSRVILLLRTESE